MVRNTIIKIRGNTWTQSRDTVIGAATDEVSDLVWRHIRDVTGLVYTNSLACVCFELEKNETSD